MNFDDFVFYGTVAGVLALCAGLVWWIVEQPSGTERAMSKMEFDGYSNIEAVRLCHCSAPLVFRANDVNGQPVEGMICCGVVTESE